MIDKNRFRNPDGVDRGAPFWALNDRLEKEEMVRQIDAFGKQGMGGVFLHPRGGMSTEYLSEDFFDKIGACIKALEDRGMIAWLYDEDRFPSGNAAGRVVKSNPDFAMRCIVWNQAGAEDEVLGFYTAEGDGFQRISGEVKEEGEVFTVSVGSTYPNLVFHGERMVDVCNKAAIDAFIRETHDRYYEHFAQYFGSVIAAIFTDEPHFHPNRKDSLPWPYDFRNLFQQKYGYDLTDFLPCLFWNAGLYQKVRHDYWSLVSSLFVEAYSKNIYDWCEQKKIAYTGHFYEHAFPLPCYTGSVMPHYEWMQYPGIDMLFVANEADSMQYGNDLIVKEASSVANQLGKKRVLSESYGASGWGLDFKHQKRALDWQLALGVNLFCQHLSLYSMTGYRKRDFPLSFSPQQPWWEHYKLLGDYIGRMSYALSLGSYQADVLVLHSSGSTWLEYGVLADNERLDGISASLKEAVCSLDRARIMFDLGDEGILSRHGRIENNLFVVGKMQYSVVVIPEMEVIRQQVLDLLRKFVDGGGCLIATGQTPYLVDGVYSEEVVQFFRDSRLLHSSHLPELPEERQVERLRLTEEDGKPLDQVYAHIRREGKQKLIFLCNLDQNQPVRLRMPLSQPYAIQRFDAETGETWPCDIYVYKEREYNLFFVLEPCNSILFLVDETKLVPAVQELPQERERKEVPLSVWQIELLDPNAVNLQFCRVSLEGDPFGAVGDVLQMDDRLKDRLSIERGNIFMRQPWMYSDEEKAEQHFVCAEYAFPVAALPKGKLMAAVEQPELFTVFVNDAEVQPNGEYYKDKAFSLFDIKNLVKEGENTIRIETKHYGVLVNLESIYLVGEFGWQNGAVTELPPLQMGNLAAQGFPYYSGKVRYTALVDSNSAFQKVQVCFDGFDGVCAQVFVNEAPVKTIGWKPYTADITAQWKHGSNQISIEIANSLQNLLGPFDEKASLTVATPGSFYAEEHRLFLPFGFNGKAGLIFEE